MPGQEYRFQGAQEYSRGESSSHPSIGQSMHPKQRNMGPSSHNATLSNDGNSARSGYLVDPSSQPEQWSSHGSQTFNVQAARGLPEHLPTNPLLYHQSAIQQPLMAGHYDPRIGLTYIPHYPTSNLVNNAPHMGTNYTYQRSLGTTPVPIRFTHSPQSSHVPDHSVSITTQITQPRSPRQHFSDGLRRGVQSFQYSPSRATTELHFSDTIPSHARASSPLASGTQITNSSHGGLGPSPSNTMNTKTASPLSSSAGRLPTSASGSFVTVPPLPAPTVPLSSRFPPLPPKPSLFEIADKEDLQKRLDAREESLLLRIDALGFEPERAWAVMQETLGRPEAEGERNEEELRDKEKPAPILGIRLLQRLDQLQRENEELASIFAERVKDKHGVQLRDAVQLIEALDKALTDACKRADDAEAKVTRLEEALIVACNQRSSAISSEISNSPSASKPSPPWKRSTTKNGNSKSD